MKHNFYFISPLGKQDFLLIKVVENQLTEHNVDITLPVMSKVVC